MSTVYNAVVLLNADTDWRAYAPGNRLVADDRTIMLLRAATPDAALARAFDVGNRQATDAIGFAWSPDVRSVSVGDVVTIIENRDGQISDEGTYACEPIGWRRIDAQPYEWGTDAMVRLGVARDAAAA